MRVGVDRTKYQIQIPLPPKIDASVTMMTVEEKPDVTYRWVPGGINRWCWCADEAPVACSWAG
jgi:ATP-dependent 26S proteasome regulatory subunit